MLRGAWRFVRALWARLGRDEVGTYASALTYNLLFALGPLALTVAAIVPVGQQRTLLLPLSAVVSPEVIALLQRGAGAQVRGALAWAGAAGYVWGMSAAFRRLLEAISRAYEEPLPRRRGARARWLLSGVLAVTLGVLLLLAMAVATAGQYLAPLVAGASAATALAVLRWGVLLAIAVIMLAVLYAVGPDRGRPLRWLSPGAVTAITAWLLLSWGFSRYLAHFNAYNLVYGSVGAVILLLLYLYFLGYALLLGAEINGMLGVR